MRIAALGDAHDSSVCVIENGIIDFFCKEERIYGIKREKNPKASIQLLSEVQKGKAPIDLFLYCVPTNEHSEEDFPHKKQLEVTFKTTVKNYSFLQHHLCHASLAFYNSGFEKCLVFVVDRNGSAFYLNGTNVAREAETVFLCQGVNSIVPLYKNFWINPLELYRKNYIRESIKNFFPNIEVKANSFLSIVKVYEAATSLIGQHVLENGKTMGLSSYGKSEVHSYFFDGDPLETKFTFTQDRNHEPGQIFFNDYFDKTIKEVPEKDFSFYADRALEVQTQTQEQVCNLIKRYVDKTGVTKVCFVGGYALNVVANGYYLSKFPELDFYFEPIADDTGISIGACMLEYANKKETKPQPIQTPFFHYFDGTEPLNGGRDCEVEEVATLLAQGKAVAVFEGNPESGPRALGHRSILLNPMIKDGKSIVNKIKKREWYRPFAGVIMQEYFEEYFHTYGVKQSPNMTINFYAKEGIKEKIPAVIHVDNSCRVQTVEKGFLYLLLQEFNKQTSCPILLNTSFNLAGRPLVQTKAQALETLNESSLDAVYFVEQKKLFTKPIKDK